MSIKLLPERVYDIISSSKYCVPERYCKYPQAWIHSLEECIMDTLSSHARKSNPINIIFPPIDETYRHYVYTLAYPGGKVFYVGKGLGNRIDLHELEALGRRKVSNPHKVNAIKKVWKEGGQIIKTKLAFFQTHEEAIAYEIALIFFLPDLTNISDGGEGPNITDEDRERKRRYAIENKTWIKMVQSNIGRKISEETREKKRLAGLGRRHSEETKKKLSKVRRGKKRTHVETEETKRKRVESRKGFKYSEESRKKMSESQKKREHLPHTQEAKDKIRAASLKHRHTEETRQKLSEMKSEFHNNRRASIKEIRLKYWRELRGMTQQELADISHVSRDAIWKIELGKNLPRPKTLQKLANALDIPLEQLEIKIDTDVSQLQFGFDSITQMQFDFDIEIGEENV